MSDSVTDVDTLPDLEFAPEPVSEPEPPGPELWWIRPAIDLAVILGCLVVILGPLHPPLLLADTTPAGGDMGAHVWGPAFLRDHLLPDFRLAGWTPDWYAGFPAYQFYMVIPSLLIVAVNMGVQGPGAIVPFLVSVALGLWGVLRNDPGRRRTVAITGSMLIAVFGIGVPYGVAFKAVTVVGVLGLPLAAYAFGRLARLEFPSPILLAVATVPFLFDRTFSIYGGNIPSTLAGEFAFSISLTLAVLYLGFVVRGLETGEYRTWAAITLALVGLCHVIPAFFAAIGTVVLFAMRPSRAGLRWLGIVAPVGGLLSAFWVVPFVLRRAYLNDMGWEKLAVWNEGESFTQFRREVVTHLIPSNTRWVFFLAVVGAVLCIAFVIRTGIFLTVMTMIYAIGFVAMPQARLWNARLLPFYYLCLYLLAALAVVEIVKSVAMLMAPDPNRVSPWAAWVTPVATLAVVAIVVGLPLRSVPFMTKTSDGRGHWLGRTVTDRSYIDSWAKWNYTGYERKDLYPEYHDIVATMAEVGATHGCGRSMWEYKRELDQYGTPMALMLLPFWTDGCIGSMEGLYFEASTTTPFHFLIQSELSAAPSSAQRDLPYRGFDINGGIRHLQLLGVRYYLATSTEAITAADGHPDLTEVARSGPWVVYEVSQSALVVPLENEPAVLADHRGALAKVVQGGLGQKIWLCSGLDADQRCTGPALDWFQDYVESPVPDEDLVTLTANGPGDWQRVEPGERPQANAVGDATVSNIVTTTDGISFDVDRVGVPVLVKSSYFPNWKTSGARGPYRVAPNLMVVVPTSEHVRLHYGVTPVDVGAYLLTLAGIALLVVLGLRHRRARAD